jgi:putative ATP-dependent endonuclease of OLD family
VYLSELKIWNFRKFSAKTKEDCTEEPGLSLKFNKGLNLLVGENDSGKTAIIDAIKLVLLTQSYDYTRLEYEDFYIPPNKSEEDDRAKSLKIECIFRGLEDQEAKNFLEWLGIEAIDGKNQYFLKVCLRGERKERKVFYDIKAGPDEDGTQLEGESRNLLRATYLKPLRDAESELIPGKRSRLAQILDSHETFRLKDKDHYLLKTMKNANQAIQNYFKGLDADCRTPLKDQAGKKLLDDINTYLEELFTEKEKNKKANFTMSPSELKHILERLILKLSETQPGLGSYNRLYIATELLLLKRDNYTGLKLALIEELEAHLHPQAQLRQVEYLQEIAENSAVQLILTSHSPNLASKIKLDNLILCKNGNAYPMGSSFTELGKGDYLFLQRFLDVTKANLFFAQGVILVEGDAENILVPAIADIIGKPLSKYGVSVVNVNSTAFLRYSRIFKRKEPEEGEIGIPVAVVTDNDIPPDSGLSSEKINEKRCTKESKYDGQGVKTFISPDWTLEYDICLSGLRNLFYRAVLYAEKIQNSDKYCLTDEKIKEIKGQIANDIKTWEGKSKEDVAALIYNYIIEGKSISKAVISQCFAEILKNEGEPLREILLADDKMKYLIDSINYVTA